MLNTEGQDPAVRDGIQGTQTLNGIRTAQATAADAHEAASQLREDLRQADLSLVMFFCSSRYDLDAVARELDGAFADAVVVGCTTAGEIGPAGYLDHTISGLSFTRDICRAVAGRIDNLGGFQAADGARMAAQLASHLSATSPAAEGKNTFAMLLIDGLSTAEEGVARAFQDALQDVPLFGGSAGDDMQLVSTKIYHDGAFRSDCAILVLIDTRLPFRIFNTQHFHSTGEPLVVTAADPRSRTVFEINGAPAAAEYARLLGTTPERLDGTLFSASPVVVVIDGSCYVRSIQKVGADGSLTFFSAIEEGVILRLARGDDLVGNLQEGLRAVEESIGPLQLVIACDCILRHLQIARDGLKPGVEEIFRGCNAVGFGTYGEQFHGVHVNQTLVAVALGTPVDGAHG